METKAFLFFLLLTLAQPIVSTSALDIVCTNPDFVPIVKEISGNVSVSSLMPSGSDPHSFSLSKSDIDRLSRADLILLTNSELFGFEKKIKREFSGKILDFEDYRVEGAKLDDFPGFGKNPHGYWLKIENAISIARTVEKKLSNLIPDKKKDFERNLDLFESKLSGIKGSFFGNLSCIAVVPGVAYVIENAGLKVGAILLGEGTGFASGRKYATILEGLKSNEYSCIVVPESMKNLKAGEIAEQLSIDSGRPVVYVKFVTNASDFAELQLYNLLAFAKTLKGEIDECKPVSELYYVLLVIIGAESAIVLFLWFRGG
jgi:ABC-type Zn uptake system ZnuABC Zn-binding protein ZnuA